MSQRVIAITAITECLLLAPAALFMAALWLRFIGAPQPVGFAEHLIAWHAGRAWTLWVLLVALPVAALAIGCTALRSLFPAIRANAAAVIIGAATLSAAGVLAVVGLHLLAH